MTEQVKQAAQAYVAAQQAQSPTDQASSTVGAPTDPTKNPVKAVKPDEAIAVAKAMDVAGKLKWASTDHNDVVACSNAAAEATRFILGVRAAVALDAGSINYLKPVKKPAPAAKAPAPAAKAPAPAPAAKAATMWPDTPPSSGRATPTIEAPVNVVAPPPAPAR
jgi:hypothetical protein